MFFMSVIKMENEMSTAHGYNVQPTGTVEKVKSTNKWNVSSWLPRFNIEAFPAVVELLAETD